MLRICLRLLELLYGVLLAGMELGAGMAFIGIKIVSLCITDCKASVSHKHGLRWNQCTRIKHRNYTIKTRLKNCITHSATQD